MNKNNTPIEINYIKEKVEKSTIITNEENSSIIETQYKIDEIKKSIIGILECTDIKEKIDKNIEGRHIYKINNEISRHILSVISNKYSKEEKKEIIKNELKELLDTYSMVLINRGNIYITDTGKKEKIIKVNNEEKKDIRFNGYQGDELYILIKEYIGDNKKIKDKLKNIINNINYSNININEITSLITLGYKSYLLNSINSNLINTYEIDNDISIAISGKILRDNFSYSLIILYENIFNTLLKNKLNNKDIEEKLINTIITNNFDFNKNKIYLNILNLNSIYDKELNIIINQILNKIYIFEGKVNDILLKVIITKLGIKFNNKKYIIKKIVDNLIDTFKKNTSKLPNATIDFLKELSLQKKYIKVPYMNTSIDIIKLSSNLKLLINDEIKIEKSINLKNSSIKKQKHILENLSTSIKGIELKYKINNTEINNSLTKVGLDGLINTELSIKSIISKSKDIYSKIIKIENDIKSLSSNKIKKTLNTNKIEQFKKQLIKYKSILRNLENIIKLEKENIELKEKIKNYYDLLNKLNSNSKQIKVFTNDLEIIKDKINQIKIGLINMIENDIK